MMQRTIGTYIAKRIKDEIFSPQDADETTAQGQGQQAASHSHYEDPLDGETIFDDDGRALGQAYRLPNVAVYVVAQRNANADRELERAINEPETELIVHREDRAVTALVYIPEQTSQAAAQTRGFRADDV